MYKLSNASSTDPFWGKEESKRTPLNNGGGEPPDTCSPDRVLPFPMSSVAFILDSQHVLGRSIIGGSHGIIRIVLGR